MVLGAAEAFALEQFLEVYNTKTAVPHRKGTTTVAFREFGSECGIVAVTMISLIVRRIVVFPPDASFLGC
jgi:hypothetical protein